MGVGVSNLRSLSLDQGELHTPAHTNIYTTKHKKIHSACAKWILINFSNYNDVCQAKNTMHLQNPSILKKKNSESVGNSWKQGPG